jgi:hypothetical protein
MEPGIAMRQGLHFLRTELPGILAKRTDPASALQNRWNAHLRERRPSL